MKISRPFRLPALRTFLAAVISLAIVGRASADIAGITVSTPSFSQPVAPRLLAAASGGTVWFSDETRLPHSVGFFTPAGGVSVFAVPCAGCDATGQNNLAYIEGMTVARDGNLWFLFTRVDGSGSFVDNGINNYVGRMTLQGTFSRFAVPTRYAFR